MNRELWFVTYSHGRWVVKADVAVIWTCWIQQIWRVQVRNKRSVTFVFNSWTRWAWKMRWSDSILNSRFQFWTWPAWNAVYVASNPLGASWRNRGTNISIFLLIFPFLRIIYKEWYWRVRFRGSSGEPSLRKSVVMSWNIKSNAVLEEPQTCLASS